MAWAVRHGVRLLAVLALVLGVLAMHGVAGAHSAAAAVPVPAAATHLGVVPAMGMPGQVPAQAQPQVQTAAGSPHAVAAGCAASCPAPGHTGALLCLAVLTVAAALLLVLGRPGGYGAPLRAPRAPLAIRCAGPPRRRLDLVADLCVCRT